MATTGKNTAPELSKAEYLKRYLSADEDSKKSKEKAKKRRIKVTEKRMRIVDDDLDWKQMVTTEENEEEEDEAPVVAEVIDDRPDEIKCLEAFRSSNKWKVMGVDDDKDGESAHMDRTRHDSPESLSVKKTRHDSPEAQLVGKTQPDLSDSSSPRRGRHDSPDLSPRRWQTSRLSPSSSPANKQAGKDGKQHCRDSSPASSKTNTLSSNQKHSPDSDQRPRNRHDSDLDQSPLRRRPQSGVASDPDQSPPRKRPQKGEALDSDQSPLRRRRKSRWGSDSDQSPPRRPTRGEGNSDDDLSPPRRPGPSQDQRMLSGGAAGLVSSEVLRKEQEENRRRDGANQGLEEASRGAQTVFRDRSGKRRDLEAERAEQRKKAGEKAAKDEKYAQWGKGLAQSQMQQQNMEDALREFQKPLARHRDDEDLDRMLREKERDGDPMAAMLRRKKDRDNKLQGIKERPRYKGPVPPPNRFNIPPGYRWDGVDRSSGFEAKRYTRMADKKAVQEVAYKWSVEDM